MCLASSQGGSVQQEPFKLDSTPTLPLGSSSQKQVLNVSDFCFFYEMVSGGRSKGS